MSDRGGVECAVSSLLLFAFFVVFRVFMSVCFHFVFFVRRLIDRLRHWDVEGRPSQAPGFARNHLPPFPLGHIASSTSLAACSGAHSPPKLLLFVSVIRYQSR